MHAIERNYNSKLKQKLPTLASWNNGIKTDVAVVADLNDKWKITTFNVHKIFAFKFLVFNNKWSDIFFGSGLEVVCESKSLTFKLEFLK